MRLLRRSGKPVVLVANKVDDQRTEADAAALWNLGLGAAVAGLGAARPGERRRARRPARGRCPQASAGRQAPTLPGGPRRVALLGRPNVGKSSLLNKLAGAERVVVDDVAGTTRDPVDELVELGGRTWRFVDTAGIRRRVHQTRGADFYASLRTQTALEKAEVAVVLVDAHEPITEQDIRVIQQVIDAGRALVIAYNKWDLIDEERRHYLEREIEQDLVQIPWAPRVNLSALTGRHTDRLVPALETSLGVLGRPGSRRAGSTRSSARSSPPTRTRYAAASSRASCSPPRRPPGRRGSCCSPPASSRPATGGSSSAGCARSSASRGPRSRSRCGSARSAAAASTARAGMPSACDWRPRRGDSARARPVR